MEDQRIWDLEQSLWTGDAEHYQDMIAEEALFVVPAPPYISDGKTAARAMAEAPQWAAVSFSDQQVSRPQEGLIIIAYNAVASADDKEDYTANCTTTLRRLGHDDWKVIQHQQTPPLMG